MIKSFYSEILTNLTPNFANSTPKFCVRGNNFLNEPNILEISNISNHSHYISFEYVNKSRFCGVPMVLQHD
jgi:hypothetical protein